MQQVYRDGDTVPGIAYTVISTRLDTTVTPYTQAFLKGAKNMTVQDACLWMPMATAAYPMIPSPTRWCSTPSTRSTHERSPARGGPGSARIHHGCCMNCGRSGFSSAVRRGHQPRLW